MNKNTFDSGCEDAKPYYYDYLSEETKVNIPGDISDHIEICEHCLSEVERLRSVLSEPLKKAAGGGRSDSSVLINNVNLHFSYIGTSVSCQTARPFLPSLADPLLAIKIPTPITVHPDKCEQCESDLQKIIKLGLSHKQLCRLGQMFAELPFESEIDCSEVRENIKDFVHLHFENLNEEILNHFCTCPNCRDLVFMQREKLIEKTDRGSSDNVLCEAVRMSDLFHFCFPYGVRVDTDKDIKFPSSFRSHIVQCPSCLIKMQEMHMLISDILEREESGVATCYHVTEQSEQAIKAVEATDALYKDWPIQVEVFERAETAGISNTGSLGGKNGDRRRQSALSRNIVPILKYASAAAAVIILALIFFNAPAARAVNLGQVYSALESVLNVHSTIYNAATSDVLQEMWFSRDLNIKMHRTHSQLVLWDFGNQVKKEANINTGSIEIMQVDSDTAARIENTMVAPLGLLPFDNTSSLPEGATWQQVPGEEAGVLESSTEVYDLIWSDESMGGADIFRKYRVYLNTATKLPHKTEFYERRGQEENYEFLTATHISYPSTDEIQAAITQYGFD